MSGEKRFTLRMDADLFEELVNTAKKHRRSTAKEVEYAIALYLRNLAEKEYRDSLDIDNMTSEEAAASLKELREISNKYNAYLDYSHTVPVECPNCHKISDIPINDVRVNQGMYCLICGAKFFPDGTIVE